MGWTSIPSALWKDEVHLPNAPDLFHGSINGYKPCVLREFLSDSDAIPHHVNFQQLSFSPNIPRPSSGGNANVPLLLGRHICFEVPYTSIFNYFSNLFNTYISIPNPTGQSFFTYMKFYYKSLYFDAISGIRDLLRRGFVPVEFHTHSTVIFDGFDKKNRPIHRLKFLNVILKTDDLTIKVIKDLRDSMRESIGLNGTNYENPAKLGEGVPVKIFNFLNYATDRFVHFMAPIDADYVLNDAMTWSKEYFVLRHWYYYMFLKDYVGPETKVYYPTFPTDWKDFIEVGSFLDRAITKHHVMNRVKNIQIDLALKIEKWEKEKERVGGGRPDNLEDIMRKYYGDLELAARERGLGWYDDKKGVQAVCIIKRNGTFHHNDNAVPLGSTLKTAKEIVKFIENECPYSYSSFFWHFNFVWLNKEPVGWEYHKSIIKGETSWQYQLEQQATIDRLEAERMEREQGRQADEEALEDQRRRENAERQVEDELRMEGFEERRHSKKPRRRR